MYQNIKDIKSIEDLVKVGSIKEIVLIIEDIIKPIKIKVETYEELFEYIEILKKKWVDFNDGDFKSEENKYLFCLTDVDGEKRNKVIGLTDDLYDNKEAAKKWYRKIVKIIRPDIKDDERTKNAFNELHKLYETVMSVFEEEN